MTSGYVSVTALKDSVKSCIEALDETYDEYVILQNSRPVAVMVSFDRYQSMKAQTTPVMKEIATYLKPALEGGDDA